MLFGGRRANFGRRAYIDSKNISFGDNAALSGGVADSGPDRMALGAGVVGSGRDRRLHRRMGKRWVGLWSPCPGSLETDPTDPAEGAGRRVSRLFLPCPALS